MASHDINFQTIARLALHRQMTSAQLKAVGLDGHAVGRRDWLSRVHRGIYSVGGPPRTGIEWAAAALLACGRRRGALPRLGHDALGNVDAMAAADSCHRSR
jgi:hypothetical protein